MYLLDSSPVLKDVDISQHVDNERPCETRRKKITFAVKAVKFAAKI